MFTKHFRKTGMISPISQDILRGERGFERRMFTYGEKKGILK